MGKENLAKQDSDTFDNVIKNILEGKNINHQISHQRAMYRLLGFAKALAKQGQYVEAIKVAAEAVKESIRQNSSAPPPMPFLPKGVAQIASEDNPNKKVDIIDYIKQNPPTEDEIDDCALEGIDLSTGRILFFLGNLYADAGQVENAIDSFKLSAKFSYTNYGLYLNMGNAYCRLTKLEDAIKCYKTSIELKPSAKAHAQLSQSYLVTGELLESSIHSTLAIGLEKDYASPYFNIGRVLDTNNKFREAISFYEKAISLRPSFLEFSLYKAKALMQIGDLAEAWQICNNILQKKPHHAEALLTMGETYFNGRNNKGVDKVEFTKKAVEYFSKAFAISQSPHLCTIYSLALMELGHVEEACKIGLCGMNLHHSSRFTFKDYNQKTPQKECNQEPMPDASEAHAELAGEINNAESA